MKTKSQQILELLQSETEPISAKKIMERIGVSSASLKSHVNRLRKEDHDIITVRTNEGTCYTTTTPTTPHQKSRRFYLMIGPFDSYRKAARSGDALKEMSSWQARVFDI